MRVRSLWSPVLGRVYGIRPWEMGRLTGDEFESIRRDLRRLDKESSG